MDLLSKTKRWVEAKIIDSPTAQKIIRFEETRFLRRYRIFLVFIGIPLGAATLAWISYRLLNKTYDESFWILDFISVTIVACSAFLGAWKLFPPLPTLRIMVVATFILMCTQAMLYLWITHLSPYQSLLTWIAGILVAIAFGKELFFWLVLASLAFILINHFWVDFTKLFFPLEIQVYLFVPAVVFGFFLLGLDKTIRWIERKTKLMDAKIRRRIRRFVFQGRLFFDLMLTWMGMGRAALTVFFLLMMLLAYFQDRLPILQEYSNILPLTVSVLGLAGVFLSLLLTEKPRFSGLFAIVAWVELFFTTVRYSDKTFRLTLEVTHYQPGRFFVVSVLLAILGMTAKIYTRNQATWVELFGLGPMGWFTLSVLLTTL